MSENLPLGAVQLVECPLCKSLFPQDLIRTHLRTSHFVWRDDACSDLLKNIDTYTATKLYQYTPTPTKEIERNSHRQVPFSFIKSGLEIQHF